MRLCVTIIALMLDKLQQSLVDPLILNDRNLLRQEQDNIELLLSLLHGACRTICLCAVLAHRPSTHLRLLESYLEFQDPLNALRSNGHGRPRRAGGGTVIFPSRTRLAGAQLPSAVRPWVAAPAESQTLYCPAQGETALVFLVLVLSSPKKHLIYFFESMFEIEGRENFTLLLAQFFKVANVDPG